MNKTAIKKVGIWFLALSLFAFHILFRSVAHAEVPAMPWKAMYTKEGECRISFPGQPQLIEQSIPLGEGNGTLFYNVYLSPFEDRGVLLLLIATYPNAIPDGHEMSGLEGLINGIVSHHPENKLTYAEVKNFGGHAAISFLIEGGGSYFRGHVLMVGNKLYLLALEGRKGMVEEAIFNRFVKSFTLSKQE